MGNEAEKTEDIEQGTPESTEAEETATTDVVDESTDEGDGEELTGEEQKDKEPGDQEFEVVRETGDSQASKKDSEAPWVKKRLSQVTAQRREAREGEKRATDQIADKDKEIELLRMQLDQANNAKPPITDPIPDEFDGGIHDPEFIKKQAVFKQDQVQREVARQIAEATRNIASTASHETLDRELEQSRKKHYSNAHKLGAKDFSETEDVATKILGDVITDEIIRRFPDESPGLLYYLGKNKAEVQSLADLFERDGPGGSVKIGRLLAEIKVKPKHKSPPADPDEEIVGGVSTSSVKERGPKGATYS